ncbi:MAG: hypothetical protein LBE24_04180 [Methylobacillus sp.]|jgi:hypothetical protein|nr:hypothetical protein [Methylobacillus sp.]
MNDDDLHPDDPLWRDYDYELDPEVKCKYCGKQGLHWDDDGDGKPVLMEGTYKVHKCGFKSIPFFRRKS